MIERKSVAISDARQVPDFNPAFFEQGYCSSLGTPLVCQNEAIGVLYVHDRKPRQFSGHQIVLLETLAGQAAIAIDRARHYEEMKKIKGYIGSNTAVDWIRMVSTAWGHGIRREVGTTLGRVALLRGLLKDQLTQEVQKELREIENAINGIKEIPITAPLSYEDAADAVRMNELIKTYLDRQWSHTYYKPVKLDYNLQDDLDSLVSVWASKEWLRRGLEIIVDNAVWAMLEAGKLEKQITVATRLLGNMIEVAIQDNGPGIPAHVLERLFKKPIPKPEGSRGAGIGLMLAQTIFQTYRGDISVGTTGNEGTTIIIVLPVILGDGRVPSRL